MDTEIKFTILGALIRSMMHARKCRDQARMLPGNETVVNFWNEEAAKNHRAFAFILLEGDN